MSGAKIDNDNNINSQLTSHNDWNPVDTRVFDVYMNKESSQNLKLLDIFSDEIKVKNIDDNDDALELLNTGLGKRSKSIKRHLFKHVNKQKFTRNSGPPTKLPYLDSTNLIDSNKQKKRTPSTSPRNLYNMKDGCDKWTTEVETAFLDSLRLIMKNGTSKIKLKERNYGRNELISLYIKYHTNETRTKKQISSHIQVWKKSIITKLSNNNELSPLEIELLQLIENGAPQDSKTMQAFNHVFEDIISRHIQEEEEGGNGFIADHEMSKSATSGAQNIEIVPKKEYMDYPTLITPHSTTTGNNPATNHFQDLQDESLLRHPHLPSQPLNPNSFPITPLDYAKSVYENLKSYKCVPVKVPDSISSPNVKGSYNNLTNREESALQSAKNVKLQQKQLIGVLNAQAKNINGSMSSMAQTFQDNNQATVISNDQQNAYYQSVYRTQIPNVACSQSPFVSQFPVPNQFQSPQEQQFLLAQQHQNQQIQDIQYAMAMQSQQYPYAPHLYPAHFSQYAQGQPQYLPQQHPQSQTQQHAYDQENASFITSSKNTTTTTNNNGYN
ncbi:hypothetical protein KAFR_0C00250 [Kazachstania africana CBS 2517]|uniref:TEA domain-containing protein n=1 Tax=Kazachstania africana (strain ATCC 22294 / BCRC 22015 / CBS 2517 / CECT 1963 / NBRC 1671 / NRRL Y-8276) TaxID=1071382 RepID=H2ARM1_KAZAF|nr:hypothetical protein KAFR_0C00250 [Kazachstania africana CBS 2517]CCF57021.1 hypothetical protein KAFR_0C00250 [Kazachstania africana CBS 2517]